MFILQKLVIHRLEVYKTAAVFLGKTLADAHIFLHSGTHKVALVRLHVVRRADDNALRNHFRLFNHRAQVFFIFHRVDRLIGERRRIKLPPHIIDADADRHPLRVQGKHVALIARKQVFRRIAADAGVRKTNAQLRVSRRHKALDDARIAVTHVVKQALAHRLCAAHIRYGIPCKNNAIHIFKNHGKLPLKE